MSQDTTGKWFRHGPDPRAAFRLICFPFAGGGPSVFRPWQLQAPAGVQVCPVELPGRESRYNEPPMRDLTTVVQEVAREVDGFLDRPYGLFGHSLGAFLAFELARLLRRRGRQAPLHLFASACRAPHLAVRRKPIHHLAEQPFLDQLAILTGQREGLKADSEVVRLLLPALRADCEMAERYAHFDEPPFNFAVTALGGSQDRLVAAGDLVAWHSQTTGRFRLRLLSGGHLFLRESPERVMQTVMEELSGTTTR